MGLFLFCRFVLKLNEDSGQGSDGGNAAINFAHSVFDPISEIDPTIPNMVDSNMALDPTRTKDIAEKLLRYAQSIDQNGIIDGEDALNIRNYITQPENANWVEQLDTWALENPIAAQNQGDTGTSSSVDFPGYTSTTSLDQSAILEQVPNRIEISGFTGSLVTSEPVVTVGMNCVYLSDDQSKVYFKPYNGDPVIYTDHEREFYFLLYGNTSKYWTHDQIKQFYDKVGIGYERAAQESAQLGIEIDDILITSSGIGGGEGTAHMTEYINAWAEAASGGKAFDPSVLDHAGMQPNNSSGTAASQYSNSNFNSGQTQATDGAGNMPGASDGQGVDQNFLDANAEPQGNSGDRTYSDDGSSTSTFSTESGGVTTTYTLLYNPDGTISNSTSSDSSSPGASIGGNGGENVFVDPFTGLPTGGGGSNSDSNDQQQMDGAVPGTGPTGNQTVQGAGGGQRPAGTGTEADGDDPNQVVIISQRGGTNGNPADDAGLVVGGVAFDSPKQVEAYDIICKIYGYNFDKTLTTEIINSNRNWIVHYLNNGFTQEQVENLIRTPGFTFRPLTEAEFGQVGMPAGYGFHYAFPNEEGATLGASEDGGIRWIAKDTTSVFMENLGKIPEGMVGLYDQVTNVTSDFLLSKQIGGTILTPTEAMSAVVNLVFDKGALALKSLDENTGSKAELAAVVTGLILNAGYEGTVGAAKRAWETMNNPNATKEQVAAATIEFLGGLASVASGLGILRTAGTTSVTAEGLRQAGETVGRALVDAAGGILPDKPGTVGRGLAGDLPNGTTQGGPGGAEPHGNGAVDGQGTAASGNDPATGGTNAGDGVGGQNPATTVNNGGGNPSTVESQAAAVDQRISTALSTVTDDSQLPNVVAKIFEDAGAPKSLTDRIASMDPDRIFDITGSNPGKLVDMLRSSDSVTSQYGQKLIDDLIDGRLSVDQVGKAVGDFNHLNGLNRYTAPVQDVTNGSGGIGVFFSSAENPNIIIKADRAGLSMNGELDILKGMEAYGGPQNGRIVSFFDPSTGLLREGLVMEKIEGVDLSKLLSAMRRGEPLPINVTDAHVRAIEGLENRLRTEGKTFSEINPGDFILTNNPNRPLVPIDMGVQNGPVNLGVSAGPGLGQSTVPDLIRDLRAYAGAAEDGAAGAGQGRAGAGNATDGTTGNDAGAGTVANNGATAGGNGAAAAATNFENIPTIGIGNGTPAFTSTLSALGDELTRIATASGDQRLIIGMTGLIVANTMNFGDSEADLIQDLNRAYANNLSDSMKVEIAKALGDVGKTYIPVQATGNVVEDVKAILRASEQAGYSAYQATGQVTGRLGEGSEADAAKHIAWQAALTANIASVTGMPIGTARLIATLGGIGKELAMDDFGSTLIWIGSGFDSSKNPGPTIINSIMDIANNTYGSGVVSRSEDMNLLRSAITAALVKSATNLSGYRLGQAPYVSGGN